MKVRDVIKLLEQDKWYHHSTKANHRQFKHHEKKGRVTIPGKLNDDLHPKTLNSILKQAGLKEKE